MRKIGYLRVSTEEQRTDRQVDALASLCDELHIEVASGAAVNRPVYRRVITKLRRGDALVILDLDRAYRSSTQALRELERLHTRGVSIQIINQSIDTTTPAGFFVFTIMAGLATFERQMLSRRTKEGLAAARRRGVTLGRPRKLDDAALGKARDLLATSAVSVAELAKALKVATWTLRRSLQRVDPGADRSDPVGQ